MRVVLTIAAIYALSLIPIYVAEWVETPTWLSVWMILFWGYEVVKPLSNRLFDWAGMWKK